jgi:protein-disulfide isomerase
MSSKSQKRTPKGASAPASDSSRRNVIVAVIVAVVVAAAAVAVIAASGGGDDDSPSGGATNTAQLNAVDETKKLLAGIPQKGDTLGKPDAPVTMYEFIDYQCPFCRQFYVSTYPALVGKAVRDGKLKIVTRPLAFIGPDSRKAARAAAAAAQQNKEAEFTTVFYNNQGQENAGYVTDAFIDKIYDAIGVDKAKANAYRLSAASQDPLNEGQKGAEQYGIVSTPSFVMGTTGGPYEKVDLDLEDQAGFQTFVDELAKTS